jgi:mannitol/fructose-specific phosphotransferase system IIA component (Ntr-type)
MDLNFADVLPADRIVLDHEAADWEEAIRAAGQLLVDADVAGPEYVQAMVDVVNRLGPYIVLVPGIALGHARPEDGAKELGFALVRLAEGVVFDAGDKDPVDLVFSFASPDDQVHLKALGAFADFVEKADNLDRLRTAKTPRDAHAIIDRADAELSAPD